MKFSALYVYNEEKEFQIYLCTQVLDLPRKAPFGFMLLTLQHILNNIHLRTGGEAFVQHWLAEGHQLLLFPDSQLLLQ